MPDGPDLAALREMLAAYDDAEEWKVPGIVREARAVLSLVDRFQAENERLREALTEYGGHQDRCATETVWGRGPCNCGWPETLDALAGSPADTKEQP